MNPGGRLSFFEFINQNRGHKGEFRPGLQDDLLPDDLCRQESFRLIGIFLWREIGRAWRQTFDHGFHQLFQTIPRKRGDGDDFFEGVELGVSVHQGQQVGLSNHVNLVQRQDGWGRVLFDQLHGELVSPAESLRGVDDQHRHVAFLERLADERHHAFVQP